MIVVIQCAARKRPQAGRMIASGRPVNFVADPRKAPDIPDRIYAHPDDRTEDGTTWRRLVAEYNKDPGNNPLGLYPAFELYQRDVYRRLVDKFDLKNVYILSAGWGLIRADFLTPSYDITFTASAEPYQRRLKTDKYADFQMLPSETEDQVVFLGGKDYLPLFCNLTARICSTPVAFYNSAKSPRAKRCHLKRFETTTRTNWHYECANALIAGSITV
jgi:hypothetical protein